MSGLPFDPGTTPVDFTNTSDVECPPHGVLACHGFEYNATSRVLKFKARRPTSDDANSSDTVYAINGPTKVDAGMTGACVMARHATQWAKVDPDYGFDEFDDAEIFVLRIGPIADQWYLSRDGSGFILCGFRDDAGNIHKERVLVLQDMAIGSVRYAKVTTPACALDCSSLQVAALTEVGETSKYVEAKFCDRAGTIIVGNGRGQDTGDPIQLYASKALRGFMARDVVVQIAKRKPSLQPFAYDAICGGLEAATGTVITAADTDYTAQVLSPGGGTVTVPAVSVHGDEFSVGQTVSLTWEWLTSTTSRLRVSDFSCQPVDTGLGVG